MEVSYYPGCSLHGVAAEYDLSVRAVCARLGVELVEGENLGENLHIGLAVSKGTLVLGSDDHADDGGGVPAGLLMAVPGTDLTAAYTQLDSGATVAVRANGGLTAA